MITQLCIDLPDDYWDELINSLMNRPGYPILDVGKVKILCCEELDGKQCIIAVPQQDLPDPVELDY
jgi:hypothetical protein